MKPDSRRGRATTSPLFAIEKQQCLRQMRAHGRQENTPHIPHKNQSQKFAKTQCGGFSTLRPYKNKRQCLRGQNERLRI